MELVPDLYKDILEEILDSNINDTVASTININLCLLRQIKSDTQSRTPLDVLLLPRLFGEATNGGNKNSSLSAKKNTSPTLALSILLRELSNHLFRLFRNYGKPKKKKSKSTLTS